MRRKTSFEVRVGRGFEEKVEEETLRGIDGIWFEEEDDRRKIMLSCKRYATCKLLGDLSDVAQNYFITVVLIGSHLRPLIGCGVDLLTMVIDWRCFRL